MVWINEGSWVGLIDGDKLTDMADAIRANTGENSLLTAEDMADEILGLSGGGIINNVNYKNYKQRIGTANLLEITNIQFPVYIIQFQNVSSNSNSYSNCSIFRLQEDEKFYVLNLDTGQPDAAGQTTYTGADSFRFSVSTSNNKKYIQAQNTGSGYKWFHCIFLYGGENVE